MVVKDCAGKIEQKRIKYNALREASEMRKEQKVLKGGLTPEQEFECKRKGPNGLFEAGVLNFILGAVETAIALHQSSVRDCMTPPEI
eukprot:5359174-Ditylum_brightwellii.AAC.1